MKPRPAGVLVLILALTLLAGCGGSGGDGQTRGSDEEAVVAAVGEYAEALANQDGEKMCRVLAPEIIDAYARDGEDCATTWEHNLESVSEQDAEIAEAGHSLLTVDDITIHGSTATLGPRVDLGVGLVEVDGRWLVNFSA